MANSVIVETSARLTEAGFSHGFSRARRGLSGDQAGGAADFALGRPKDALAAELDALGRTVGFDPSRLYQVKQVHGTRTWEAEGDPAFVVAQEGDAVIARAHGSVAGVRVADCVPVLVGSREHGRGAAIHAGWRGVERGIVGVAVRQLVLPEVRDTSLVAAIGPCIGPCCFEVSVEVAELIASAVGEPRVVVERYEPGKAKVDLRLAVRVQLRREGLSDDAIDDVGGCSVCTAGAAYHSFRRDGDASGRMIAVIAAR